MLKARLLLALFTLSISGLASTTYVRAQDIPEKINVCQLKQNLDIYNHKLIQITGFVSHGFEDFMLWDPTCPDWPGIWLNYGGTVGSGTVYCCPGEGKTSRKQPLKVEDIVVPLVEDSHFGEFHRLLQRKPDSVTHATIIGRFFAGKASDIGIRGYGHMGCCSLLVIQQILSVDPQNRDDLDYGFEPDQPNMEKTGCGYRDLLFHSPHKNVVLEQQSGDVGGPVWVFEDPRRVAVHTLAEELKIDENSIEHLTETRKVQGRVVYEWNPKTNGPSYMIVVSRPFVLSYYARNPTRIAWVAIAAYESSCPN